MGLTVRIATESDLEALTGLFLQGAEYHSRHAPYQFRVPSVEWSREFLKGHLQNPNVTFLLAELRSKIIGELRAELRKSPDIDLLQPQLNLHIEEVVVDQGHRRQGVAKILMASIEETARRLEVDQLILSVWHFNDSARRLYSGLGYDVQRSIMKRSLK